MRDLARLIVKIAVVQIIATAIMFHFAPAIMRALLEPLGKSDPNLFINGIAGITKPPTEGCDAVAGASFLNP